MQEKELIKILLPIIPQPEINTRAVLIFGGEGTTVISGDGNNYSCGNCNSILIQSLDIGQIDNIVIKCNKCGSYNDVLLRKILEVILNSPAPIKIADELKDLTEKAEIENFTQEKYVRELEKINPFLKFLIECIPKNNKDWKNAIAFLITLLLPLIYEHCKSEKSSNIQNYNIELQVHVPEEQKKYIPKKVIKNSKIIRIAKKKNRANN